MCFGLYRTSNTFYPQSLNKAASTDVGHTCFCQLNVFAFSQNTWNCFVKPVHDFDRCSFTYILFAKTLYLQFTSDLLHRLWMCSRFKCQKSGRFTYRGYYAHCSNITRFGGRSTELSPNWNILNIFNVASLLFNLIYNVDVFSQNRLW